MASCPQAITPDLEHPCIEHQYAPISLQLLRVIAPDARPLFGGLRCRWCMPYRPGSCLQLSIGSHEVRLVTSALVTRCALNEYDYSFELAFFDPQQAFQIRMIEQLCQIQHYREQIQREEGRRLDRNQAAAEWISRFAEDFPAR